MPLGAQGNSMHGAGLAALSSGKAAQPSSTSPALGRDTDGLGDDRLTWRPQPSPAQATQVGEKPGEAGIRWALLH